MRGATRASSFLNNPMSTTSTEPPVTGRRRRAARGTMINSGFQIGFGSLNLLKALIAASFLSASDYAIWGILLLAVIFTGALKTAAVGDKYLQQDEADQDLAFKKAFTLELYFSSLLFAGTFVFIPLLALIYGQSELIVPGLVLSLTLPAMALQAPTWIFYRRMDFLRQRMILALDPIVGFVVTVALAVAGAGYWSLIAGVVAGSLAAGALAMAMSPIRPSIHYEPGPMREYFRYSWPLVLAAAAGSIIGQVSLLLGNLALGLAGAGAIALAATLAFYTDSIDRIVTQTLYPAICRVKDQGDLLFETFIKSNRLTLMWGMPFGIGLGLFAADLVHLGIGDQWTSAIGLIQVWGVAAAFNHLGFNWDAFYRARGDTKPVAVVALGALAALAATAGPLVFVLGIDGFAIGVVAMTLVTLALRRFYLGKLFPQFALMRFTLRALAPTAPAVAVVLCMRALADGDVTTAQALTQFAAYTAVVVAATMLLERKLILEAVGYLRRRRLTPTPLDPVLDRVTESPNSRASSTAGIG
jgi:O-antigen/teichoic acid export membrane protein